MSGPNADRDACNPLEPAKEVSFRYNATASNRFLARLRTELLKSIPGMYLFRCARWLIPLVAPYTPPRTELTTDRVRAFVKAEIRPSTIPGAGQGLFALERIEAGVTIGEYSGDIVDSVLKSLRLRDKDYVMLTSDPAVSIDPARRPEVMMRYVCHHPREEKRNVRYRNEGVRTFLETIRPIEPGEELFADYGETYWRVRGVAPKE